MVGMLRLVLRILGLRVTRRVRHSPPEPPSSVAGGVETRPITVRREAVVASVRRETVVASVRRETVIASAVLEGAILIGKCWVIDGDTITIQGQNIRLAGIDAPELDHPYGRVAKATLMRLCRGQDVRAEFSGALSYERGVATCFLPDGRDLSAEMVKAGLALDRPKHSGGKYRSLEPADARRKLWRCDARQKGRMPPTGTRPNRPQPPPA